MNSNAPAPQMRQDELERMVLRQMCEEDHLFFTRYFFKLRENQKFLINWHHVYLSRIIDRILTQDDGTNWVVNIAPGSSKTEMFVINLMARGLALNSWSRFLHISSSDDLVLTNSQKTRDLVESEEYQALWPARIATDAKSTRRWNVEVDGKIAGGVYAVPLGGQITGFRAGRMSPGFNGAIIIDDPLKADDGFSKPAIKLANRRLLSTVKSRKARPDVPTIVVMQRLNPDDCTGFIQGGNLPGKWEFVEIPALLDDAFVETLPEDIRPRVGSEPRDEKGRFSYWEYKEPLEELLQLESGNGADSEGRKISSYVFMSQYQQRPKRLGGNIIHGEHFVRLQITPRMKYRNIYGDTAQKIKEANDFSVMEEWGLMEDGRIFLGDMLRGKFEAPDLLTRTCEFWNKSKAKPPATHGHLRALKVEDKSSGTGLIQEIKRRKGIPVFGIPRDKARKDKLTRVMDALPYIEAGMVCVSADAPWLSDFIAECEAFTADDTHAHDDQIDPLCDAIMDLIGAKPGSGLNAF